MSTFRSVEKFNQRRPFERPSGGEEVLKNRKINSSFRGTSVRLPMQARPELQIPNLFTRPVSEIIEISENWRDPDELSAEKVEATFVRGYYHVNDRYLEKNVDLGWKLIRKAAEAGHPVAIAHILDLEERPERQKSDEVSRLLRDSTHPIGIFYFGIRYIVVREIRNTKLAFDSFKKSAEMGFPDAALNLAICYASHTGASSRDYVLAVYWCLFAVRKNLTKAKEIIGSFVRYAIEQEDPLRNFHVSSVPGFGKDPKHPIWTYLSSPKDGPDVIIDAFCDKSRVAVAICIIDEVWVEILPSKRALYHQRAFELLESCREAPEAQIHLAICFAKGIGTEKNTTTATNILRNAMEAGNPFARSYLDESLSKDPLRDLETLLRNVRVPF